MAIALMRKTMAIVIKYQNFKKWVFKALMLAGLALLMALQGASAQQTKTVKVFLLGGQSNMNGTGSKASELISPYNNPIPYAEIWNLIEKQWVPLPQIGIVYGPAKQTIAAFGPEISFAHSIEKSYPDSDIWLIKYAANGSALYNDWAPNKGRKYIGFMSTVKEALADLNAKNIKYEIAGMLWLQGESDAKEQKGKEYKKNLLAFIKHMRAELNTPKMPFVIARVRNHYGKGIQAKMVRDAQEYVANNNANVEWFDTDDCGSLVKGGHYSSVGLIEIGKRFAKNSH